MLAVEGDLPSGSSKLLIAMSARADSEMPARTASALKRAFSAAEGRAVMDGNDALALCSIMAGCGDLLQTRTRRYPATTESTSHSEAHIAGRSTG